MKRIWLSLILLILVTSSVYGQDPEVFVLLNGEDFLYKEDIYIKNGRTMVEANRLFDALNLVLAVDVKEGFVYGSQRGMSIGLSLNYGKGTVNGDYIHLDASADIINQKIYVPLRFVVESLGGHVTWDGDNHLVTIDWSPYRMLSTLEILEAIQYEGQKDTMDYGIQRYRYQEIVSRSNDLIVRYENQEENLLEGLVSLIRVKGFDPGDLNLQDQMQAFHKDLEVLYQADLHKDNRVSRDGYYQLNFDMGYYYGYYQNLLAEGYKFGYTQYDQGYILSLVPYRSNKRHGTGYKMVFNHQGDLKYDMFYQMEDNQSISLDYVRYTSGIRTLDRGDVLGDSLVRIEGDGKWFIPPIDDHGKSHVKNPGVGYYLWPNDVEYIGYFDNWHIIGQGMYFAVDEGYLKETNLLHLRAQGILDEVIDQEMTPEDKVRQIHDYLAGHIRYDYDLKSISHNAYGALVMGEAVCDGYAESFKYLLDLVGIDNHLIYGQAKGIDHAWNLIALDGAYYHFDLTWNDDDIYEETINEYFKRDSEFFKASHSWDQEAYQSYLSE